MKKMSFILLCCSAFLVACDKASEEVSNATNEMTEKVDEGIDNAIDSTVEIAKDTTEKVVEETKEEVSNVVDSAKASAKDVIDSVKDTTTEEVSDITNKSDTVAAASKESISEPGSSVDLEEGEKIFKTNCIACHGSGIAGSPKIGEKADWDKRIAKGKAVLIDHAINGFRGEEGYYMPAKGGSKDLSDQQVANVVEYMISKVK